MTPEEERNTEIMHRFVESINEGGLAHVDGFFAPEVKNHNRFSGQVDGIEGLKENVAMLSVAFPDWHEEFEEILAVGDKVALRCAIRATHLGPFMGLPPTGKTLRTSANTFFRMKDGKIVEAWLTDENILAGFLLQILGTSPPTKYSYSLGLSRP